MSEDKTAFRTKIEPNPGKPLSEVKQGVSTPTTDAIEVPYLDYRQMHSKPYLVDHFQLGDTWEDPVGGFPKEIATLEGYFKELIEDGEIANNIDAIKSELKKMEKFTNVKQESRPLVKIETLAAYVEFLLKTKNIKRNIKHYGSSQQT